MGFLLIAQLLAAEPTVYQTPWYLPRTAAVQLGFSGGAVSPALRLGWELDLIEQPRNALVATLLLGVGYAVSTPRGIYTAWQTMAMLGLGYRMQRESGLHWGLDAGVGAAMYGHRGETSVEQKLSPYIEGRVNIGYRFEQKLTVSLCGGYGQWLSYDRTSISQLFLGGGFFGVLLGWK